uniref:Plac8 onzin related protein 6 n=1 Tax=Echeneis naucrates TaxID=173247 RepID=A0A665VFI8_ECHNA
IFYTPFTLRYVLFSIKVHCSESVAEVQRVMASETSEWNSELCDCFESASTCCYGFWCCPCLACTVSGRFGENRCLPLCDVCTPAIMTACGVPLFVPPVAVALWASLRNRYKIKGSICKDIIASCFCVWCVWCQMHRELKDRKKHSPVVVNHSRHS